MSVIDEYHKTLPVEVKIEFERIRSIIMKLVPEAEETMKYGMASYALKGKGVLSAVMNKDFLSVYPFSGQVPAKLEEELKGFDTTPGSIHFSLEKPIPTPLLELIIRTRLQELETTKK